MTKRNWVTNWCMAGVIFISLLVVPVLIHGIYQQIYGDGMGWIMSILLGWFVGSCAAKSILSALGK